MMYCNWSGLRNLIPYGMFVLFLLTAYGCSRQMQISVVSSNDVNNGGNPVVVRIYQLKSDVNFQRASIEAFWSDDTGTLGGDLIGDPIEVTMRPDETRRLQSVDIEDDAVYLAAAADFYRPDQNRWRHIFDITEYKGKEVFVLVGNNRIAISPPR